ncbi:MAG TPA: hypothetical protein VLW05_04315 [Gaiellaceae bacterium]|nr:hypothetical protein [Gaiellaceae bacterium]
MAHRRIALLAVVLVSAAASLASAPGALALPRAIINQFTGARVIRAEVIVLGTDGTAQDYRIDRGTIVLVTPVQLTLRELNGDMVPVPIDSGTQVQGGHVGTAGQLRRGMRVVVYQLAGAPAQIVQGDGINPQFFGPRLVRAEVLIVGAGGATQDYRIDRGVVMSAVSGTLTLRESDGTTDPLPVDPNAQVAGGGRRVTATTLRKGTHVVVYRSANAPAELVQVEAGP